jgi:apolipoprotein N-acyltransferase
MDWNERLATPISPGRRFLGALATWTLLVLATPGCLTRPGSAGLAAVALVPWGLTCVRPGRKAFLMEFLAAFLGMTGLCWWITYVWAGALLTVGVMPALWVALAGVLLRRLAQGSPLWLAVPLAWTFGDTLRHTIEPPFTFGWMRHGFHLADWPVIAGSARVWGVGGLTFVLAALAGGLCSFLVERDSPRRWRALVFGGTPLALAFLLAALTSAPATRPGPRLLLVQPGIEQARKQHAPPGENLRICQEATERGLAAAGEEGVDLVCWGETMLPATLFEPGLEERIGEDLESPPWVRPPFTAGDVARYRSSSEEMVQLIFFGKGSRRPALIPPGTSFLSGAEYYLARDGWIRRTNSIFLWNARGERGPVSSKRHLVPGGETMLGLERLAWVRDTAQAVAGYLPDLVAGQETGLQELVARDGSRHVFSASVCFDNLYDDLYVEPVAAGKRVDFHLICSNEAWFRTSWEMDQMVAFSKLIAIFSGRPVVRVTNSGVTCVIDAQGRELARLENAEGRDRGVGGALAVRVPVSHGEGGFLPYPSLRWAWLALWMLFPWLLVRFRGSRSVTGEGDGVRAETMENLASPPGAGE